jgi:purine-binding chemotaxis protein CheW
LSIWRAIRATVVSETNGFVVGHLVDGVSDSLSLLADVLQPVPMIGTSAGQAHAEGIIARDGNMICFLNLEGSFRQANRHSWRHSQN